MAGKNKMKNLIIILTVFIVTTANTNAQWVEPSAVAWNSQNVYSLFTDGSNIYAGTGSAGVSFSTNNGNSWMAVNNGLTSTGISAFAKLGSNIFAAGWGVFVTSNNGGLWSPVFNGLTDTTVNALAVSGNNIFAGTNGGVYLSTNNGGLWTAANNGFTGQIHALAVIDTNIFAGAPNNGIYLSSNNGGLWTSVNNGLTNIDVRALATSGKNIFAGTSGGVFLSSNNGALWTAVNSGLTNLNIYALLVNGTTIFAGSDSGVFYSKNMGTNWYAFNKGFPPITAVQAFTISGTYIFAGIRLNPHGVWRRPFSEATSVIENKNHSTSFNLFPNPASDIITLNFETINSEDLTLNIYNMTGNLVKSEMLKPNKPQFYIGDLSNGIYVVEINSKEWTKKQKLIIQR